MSEIVLKSPNLTVRTSVFEDCELFYKWECDPDISKLVAISDEVTYKQIVTEFILRTADPNWEQFTIVHREIEKPIGRIVLSKILMELDTLSIYRLYIGDVNSRNKGYGEEAMRDILEYGFLNLHTERVEYAYPQDDEYTQRLCEKIGFFNEGIMRHAAKKGGKYKNLYRTSLVRAEYYDKIHNK